MNSLNRARLATLAILLVAAGLRLAGIGVESFWSDEAFSAAASQGSVLEILETNARDIHPPAYYLGLHAWRSLVPEGDVGMRLYSSIWSLLGVLVLMIFAREVGGERCALYAGLFAAVNPLDIYFAQEARMYSQTTTLALASTLCLWRWWQSSGREAAASSSRLWAAAYVACASLLLLTHYVAVTFLVGQGIVALALFALERDWRRLAGYGLAAAGVALVFTPWLLYVLSFRESLIRLDGLEWMPIPGWQDYLSFTWNEAFWGRVRRYGEVGSPYAPLLPISILAVGLLSAQKRGFDPVQLRRALFVAGHLIVPLVICAIVSSTYQVVYYRPRYSVILLPYLLVALAGACSLIPGQARLRSGVAVLLAAVMLLGSVVQARTAQKRSWRETAEVWPVAHTPSFYVILPAFHQRPLGHYLDGRVRHTPRNVLERLSPLPEGALIWVASWPEDLAPEDAAYRDWLEGVGGARHLTLPTFYSITQLEPDGEIAMPDFAAQRFRAFYRPFDIQGRLGGFSDARNFGELRFDPEGNPYRWSAASAWLRLDGVAPGEEIVLKAEPAVDRKPPVFAIVRGAVRDLRSASAESAESVAPSKKGELRFTAPEGEGPVFIGWVQPPETTHRAGGQTGLRIEWVAVASGGVGENHLAQKP